jgi:electron transfer flavoprotein beta subunit
MNALELALSIKERHGGHVTVITMGPPRASDVLRDCLDRGADRVILVTDRRCSNADTLATSYTLSQAVKKVGGFDLVLCGRQAIDGDTAQVGPQVADKLGIPQVTYTERIEDFRDNRLLVRRAIEGGYELVDTPAPALLTVLSAAGEPRPPSAKLLMRYKRARSRAELEFELMASLTDVPGPERKGKAAEEAARIAKELAEKGLLIEQWDADDLACEPERIGHAGSPTRVKDIESVVLAGGEGKPVEPTQEGVTELMHELVGEHILG